MVSASKKWRDFKNTLKRKYFDENLTEEENVAKGCDKRIPAQEWKWLVNHWCQEETKARSRQRKQVRANQATTLHTCGSRSYAVVSDQLEGDLGREPSRAEMYIVTHTKANGQSLNAECQDKIDVIRDRIENDHSLAFKTVDDGDLKWLKQMVNNYSPCLLAMGCISRNWTKQGPRRLDRNFIRRVWKLLCTHQAAPTLWHMGDLVAQTKMQKAWMDCPLLMLWLTPKSSCLDRKGRLLSWVLLLAAASRGHFGMLFKWMDHL